MVQNCCRTLGEGVHPVESPFRRLVATGFYDGATAGIVECGGCGSAYCFEVIAWDVGQDSRVYLLRPVDADLDEIESGCAHDAVWPAWVLGAQTEDVAIRIESIKAGAGLPTHVIASAGLLQASMMSWHALPGGAAR